MNLELAVVELCLCGPEAYHLVLGDKLLSGHICPLSILRVK